MSALKPKFCFLIDTPKLCPYLNTRSHFLVSCRDTPEYSLPRHLKLTIGANRDFEEWLLDLFFVINI